MPRFSQLNDWLRWLETLHPKAIDLGLQRVHTVACALDLLQPASVISHEFSAAFKLQDTEATPTVITVAGTNGKGSCVSVLEQSLINSSTTNLAAQTLLPGLVGSYTSPHIHHFCERIRIDMQPVSEALVCDAFAAIDTARGDLSLTYFEFGTLAALWIFAQKNIPTIILEVGLGGRLDAVNIVDADIAVVTSIDVDHEEWLGSDRNIISQEKLGVARAGRPLVIAEINLTPALHQAANSEDSLLIDRDFSICLQGDVRAVATQDAGGIPGHLIQAQHWQFQYKDLACVLPLPSLPLPSVAAALVVLDLIERRPVPIALTALMHNLTLTGRFQKTLVAERCVIFDVAHNPAAAVHLASRLSQEPTNKQGRTLAVMAVMSDKDHDAILKPLLKVIDHWYLGDLVKVPRAARARDLSVLMRHYQCSYDIEPTIENAFHKASSVACEHDRIIVFGSFYTVAAIQSLVDH
ncbi:MAG: dihydrofolate synthase/folylpolyglutamate synthase [Pseudohongiellaceae bacterium]|jgi:dihydrofolate synthase/folylpolyglutamate synthase